MEILRAKGLLSTRGIFEHVLNLIHDEQTTLKGKFNATNVCTKLNSLTSGKFDLLSIACGSFYLTFMEQAAGLCLSGMHIIPLARV